MIYEKDLESTAINHIKYDTITKILSVSFVSGGIYDYPGVPQDEVIALAAAPSVGKYFHANIRKYSVK